MAGEEIDKDLVLGLSLAGTFVFGLSGGLAGVRARFDFFGVITLAAVVGLAGGITRDLLIGEDPAAFRDWIYLGVAGLAGVVSFFARPGLERREREILIRYRLRVPIAPSEGRFSLAAKDSPATRNEGE